MQRFSLRLETALGYARFGRAASTKPADPRRIRLPPISAIGLQKRRPQPLTTFATFLTHGLFLLRQGFPTPDSIGSGR
jgi:hypothetical protein